MALFSNKKETPEQLDPAIQGSIHVMPAAFKASGLTMVTPQKTVASMTVKEEVPVAPPIPQPVVEPKRISPWWYVGGVVVLLIVATGLYVVFFSQPQIITTPIANIPVVVPEEPVIPEEPAVVVEPEVPVVPIVSVPQIKPMTVDTDNDGLTDVEELVYQTTPANPDMDMDGYPDGLEVKNLYNPIGFAPVRIEDSGLVQVFSNSQENYQFVYPKEWQVQSLLTAPRDVMLTPPTVSGEYFQIAVIDNPQQLPLLTWYMQEVVKTEIDASIVKRVVGKNMGKEGILSADNQTVYFDVGNRIFAIQYHAESVSALNYPSVFVMLYQGFKADQIMPTGLFEIPASTGAQTPVEPETVTP